MRQTRVKVVRAAAQGQLMERSESRGQEAASEERGGGVLALMPREGAPSGGAQVCARRCAFA
jgi:hypothetical protein